MSVAENIKNVRERMNAACLRAGRDPKEVTLISVSKTKPVSMLMEAYEAGERDYGENKVQEITEKRPQIPEDAKFHMIGHLQTNKVGQVIDKVVLIHSCDSVHLAEKIEKEAAKRDMIANVLLEVNVAREESKFGMFLEDVIPNLKEIQAFPHVCVKGMMTIAPNVENAEENRKYFKELYQLYVDIKNKNIDNGTMSVLSMGMTGDFEVAVEEGATMIRVGTGIFGSRELDMSFLGKIMDTMRLNDDEDDDYFLDDDYEDEKPARKNLFKKQTADDFDDYEEEKPRFLPRTTNSNKVVPMRRGSGMEVSLIKPTSLDDAKEICDYLLAGKAVVLNMEGIHTETAQRIIDFTSGSTYSMNGNLQKISNYIFIATPQSVELSGDFQDLLTGGNLDVSGLNIHL